MDKLLQQLKICEMEFLDDSREYCILHILEKMRPLKQKSLKKNFLESQIQ